jgi:hypothetical protein
MERQELRCRARAAATRLAATLSRDGTAASSRLHA